jgi:hypothetical protein
MNSIILRSDLRCPRKCDGRIIEKRGHFGNVEYLCDRCKIAVQPVPRMRLSEVDYMAIAERGKESARTQKCSPPQSALMPAFG